MQKCLPHGSHSCHIKYVLHGHKHVPYFMNKKGTYYISAGSATGGLKESESHYYSYNVIAL